VSRRREQGFTLVEMLLALVLAGFVGTLVFQMLSAQGRFAQMQSSREEVQQNARAALDLVTGELRAVPRGAVVAAEADRIVAEVPFAWGLLCAPPSGGTVSMIVPDVLPAAGARVQLAMSDSITLQWTRSSDQGLEIAVANQATAEACRGAAGLNADGTGTVYTVTGNGFIGTAARGSTAYLFRRVEYSVGTSEGFPGQWLIRSWGSGEGRPSQPIAGPLQGEGLAFRYFLDNDAAPSAAPGTDANALARVTRVGVTVRSSATRESVPGRREQDEQTTLVHLRNSILLN
jgi:prepilin-type N-terminal cleavage/methylation domain-containing protein